MNILIAGANGKTGMEVVERLLEDDHNVRAMVKERDQVEKFEKLGAEVVLANLEGDVSMTVMGCDAVIFTAGSGSGTSEEKTYAVDRDGANKLIEACERLGVSRFIMLSAAGADNPEDGPEEMYPYLKAKHDADEKLIKSNLNYTIFRAKKLTDERETGLIRVEAHIDENGAISRADVAETLVKALDNGSTYRKVVDLMHGEEPILEALDNL
jgi:uncharacterized protein YbjT (DUF2867 family)